MVRGSDPPGAENIVRKLYCIERREEELDLCTQLFHNLCVVKGALHNKPGTKVHSPLRRYLFGHWVVRLVTGIYHAKPALTFLASPESPLLDLCADGQLDLSTTPNH